MRRFIEGQERPQGVAFPGLAQEGLAEGKSVRTIVVFVEEMGSGILGFARSLPAAAGRPGYDPAALPEIRSHGYGNRVQSSRGRGRAPGAGPAGTADGSGPALEEQRGQGSGGRRPHRAGGIYAVGARAVDLQEQGGRALG